MARLPDPSQKRHAGTQPESPALRAGVNNPRASKGNVASPRRRGCPEHQETSPHGCRGRPEGMAIARDWSRPTNRRGVFSQPPWSAPQPVSREDCEAPEQETAYGPHAAHRRAFLREAALASVPFALTSVGTLAGPTNPLPPHCRSLSARRNPRTWNSRSPLSTLSSLPTRAFTYAITSGADGGHPWLAAEGWRSGWARTGTEP